MNGDPHSSADVLEWGYTLPHRPERSPVTRVTENAWHEARRIEILRQAAKIERDKRDAAVKRALRAKALRDAATPPGPKEPAS